MSTTNPPFESLFARIAEDLSSEGLSVTDAAIPENILFDLSERAMSLAPADLQMAGVGRKAAFEQNQAVRSDQIRWLSHNHPAEARWLELMAQLQQYLNRRLYLGLFSYECHFAHYAPGAHYQKHMDAFRGEANRILSTVLYLNQDWEPSDGGELLVYCPDQNEQVLRRVSPEFGRLCVFLSEEFPHEVLAAKASRWSIAGWFRLNTTNSKRVDPPD